MTEKFNYRKPEAREFMPATECSCMCGKPKSMHDSQCSACKARTSSRANAARQAQLRKKGPKVDQVFIAGDYSKYLLQIHGVKP